MPEIPVEGMQGRWLRSDENFPTRVCGVQVHFREVGGFCKMEEETRSESARTRRKYLRENVQTNVGGAETQGVVILRRVGCRDATSIIRCRTWYNGSKLLTRRDLRPNSHSKSRHSLFTKTNTYQEVFTETMSRR